MWIPKVPCTLLCFTINIRHWHRALLNPKKLIDVNFLPLTRNVTMQRTLKLCRLAEETKTPGLQVLEHKDIEQTRQLLNKVETIRANFKVNAIIAAISRVSSNFSSSNIKE